MSGKDYKNKIITIPNLLSMVRLLLIPVIVWLYCVEQEYAWAVAALVLSGFTDMADGYIARRFGMISNLGKALDPIADKLTQIVALFCLTTRFPFVWAAVIFLVVKEVLNGLLHLMLLKKTGIVYGADWHGKVTTFLLYAVIILHFVWIEIPAAVSNISIILCIGMMSVSMFLQIVQSGKRMRGAG